MSLESKFDKFFPGAPELKKYPFRWNRKKRWYVWHFIIIPNKIAWYEKNKKTARILLENQERYMQNNPAVSIDSVSVPTDLLKMIRLNLVNSMDKGIVFGEYLPMVDVTTLSKEEQEFYKKHGKSFRINK